jgi:hypothetical protein
MRKISRWETFFKCGKGSGLFGGPEEAGQHPRSCSSSFDRALSIPVVGSRGTLWAHTRDVQARIAPSSRIPRKAAGEKLSVPVVSSG